MSMTNFPSALELGTKGGRTGFNKKAVVLSGGIAADYIVTSDGSGGTTWTAKGVPPATVEQHGSENFVSAFEATITFSTPFPGLPTTIVISQRGGSSLVVISLSNVTANGFKIELSDYFTGDIDWIAKA